MRNARTIRTVGVVAAVLLVVVCINAFAAHGMLGQWAVGKTSQVLVPALTRLSWAKAYLDRVGEVNGLVRENIALTDEVTALRAQVAQSDFLQSQAQMYRTLAGIREHLTGAPIAGGLIRIPSASGAADAVTNRGGRDGVAAGDVVVSSHGAVIGLVRDVFSDHSIVTSIGDPALQVAASVLGTAVTGLLRVDGNGLLLDLVKKDEGVREAATVVTSGNDQFPPGLVIGTVRSVDTTQATLFAVIRVTAADADALGGPVIIMHP